MEAIGSHFAIASRRVSSSEAKPGMDDDARQPAFLTALTTEHLVLQTAASSTISEAAARSSLYVFALWSSVVAMGFTSQSPDVLTPFVAAVVPAVFLLGVFTVVRLLDTVLENSRYLAGIARIRGYYRTLTPEAATYFATETGRRPEPAVPPALGLGPTLAFLGMTASMIAFINSVVAGVGVVLLVVAPCGRRPRGSRTDLRGHHSRSAHVGLPDL